MTARRAGRGHMLGGMKRAGDRLWVFGLALLLQAAVSWVLGPPPGGRATWLAWGLAQSRRLETLPPRLRVLAPLAAALAAVRLARAVEAAEPDGPARAAAIGVQAALLASTFDAWRGLRKHAPVAGAPDVQTQLREAPVDEQGRFQPLWDSAGLEQQLEAEIGRLANAPAEALVGPWAAFAAFDVSGAVAFAATDALSGQAGGSGGGGLGSLGGDGALSALLDPTRRLGPLRRGRDAIAAAATLAARGRSDVDGSGSLGGIDLEELALGAEQPLAVTAMSVALDRRAAWQGQPVGWQRPPPTAADLSRARRLHLKSLALLACGTAAGAALNRLFRSGDGDERSV